MEGKYDLFTKVSDRRDIVDFVKEIEKYPCLYDKTSPEYANKVHNRKAWTTIARKINTTVPDCRDKWRKIRISFMRSLKQQHSDKPPMRPYYLSEDLQFLRPFLTINPTTSSKKEEKMDYDTSIQKKQEHSDSDSTDTFDIEIAEDEPEMNRVTLDRNSIIKTPPKEIVYVNQNARNNLMDENQYAKNGYNDEKSYGRNNYGDEKPYGRNNYADEKPFGRNSYGEEKSFSRNSYGDDIEANPRKMFLLSLLPDVDCFTESEMRIFRREVIGVCDSIMNKRTLRIRY